MLSKTTLGTITAVFTLAIAFPGCSDDKEPSPSGNDAGTSYDSTGTVDSSPPDATPSDTPSSIDAEPDASSGSDAPSTPDAHLDTADGRTTEAGAPDGTAADGEAGAAPPKASSCSIVTDKKTPIPEPAGRLVYCGIDIGSKNVKISVVSMERGKPGTVKDERQCKRNLGLGTLVFDSGTNTAAPLSEEYIGYLIDTVKEFQTICALDKGTLLGADATHWARDATNIQDVVAKVKAGTGLGIDVLTGEQEGKYGYVAATLDSAGHISLDPGSNSFQISWRLNGTTDIGTVSVPLGYVRASTNDIEPAADYATGRTAYVADATQQLGDALGKLAPPTTLAAIKQLVTDGKLGKEIIAVGQDGAVDLVVRNKLKDMSGTWISDQKAYDDLVAAQVFKVDPTYGTITSDPIVPGELTSFLASVSATDFAALKKEPTRTIYGQKGLVVPALLDMLTTQLGLDKVVLVPQEMVTGYILGHLPPVSDF